MPSYLWPIVLYAISYFAAWYVLRWIRPDPIRESSSEIIVPKEVIAAGWPLYLLWRLAEFVGRHVGAVWTSLSVVERTDRLMWLLTKVEVPDSRYDKRPNDRLYQGRKPGLSMLWKEIRTDSFNTGKRIYLPVPPEIVRVRQGLAWGFDISEADYDPEIAG